MSKAPSPKKSRAKPAADDLVDDSGSARDAAEEAADARAEAEAAREEAEIQASPDDDPEVAARKARRRAELEAARAERAARLANRQSKEGEREARAANRAQRATEREARLRKAEELRADRERRLAEVERVKAERAAKIAADAAARRARLEVLEAQRSRRALTPEEEAEARAYAESEAPERPSTWKFQLQVIKALVLRSMGARFGTRSRLSYIWALLNPILLMCGLILVFTLRARVSPPNLPLMVFVMTGYPIWFGFYGMWGEVSRSDDDPSMLMFPQVTVLDLIISSIVLEFATTTVVYLLLIFGTVLLSRTEFPDDFMGLMFAYWGCVWLGASFGLIICSVRRFMPMFEEWMMPARRAGIFISGVIFTGATLPSWTLPYFSWNPLFRAIETARVCWHNAYQSPIADPGYVVLCGFGLTAVGIVAERLTRRYSGE